MNTISKIVVIAYISLPIITQAQNKELTIAEATNGLNSTFVPKGAIRGTAWQPGTHVLHYMADSFALTFNANTRKTDTIAKGKDAINYTWLRQFDRYYVKKDTLYLQNIRSENGKRTAKVYLKDAENITVEPVQQNIAYTRANNIHIVSANGISNQITADSNEAVINGQAVHRNEFGIDKGLFFSPKGSYLAYYRMDQSMVKDYPVIDWSVVPAVNRNIKYPMAGEASHQVSLQVYHIATQKTTTMKVEGPKDQYLTCISWSPDEKYVFIGVLSRNQKHLQLNMYDAATGNKVRTILEEKDSRYVEPQHELSFLPGSNIEFIWWSQRDGYMHLYKYNTSGKLLAQLTSGNWIVNEIAAFNKDTKQILITATKDSPLEKHVYAVNWNSRKIQRLDTEPGIHNIVASDDGRFFYDSYSAANIPRVSLVRTSDGKQVSELANAKDPLAEYWRPEVRNITLKASDGTPLYGRLILPYQFDSTKKYPVIVYLYNGPHVQLVQNRFPASGNLWYDYMARKGYVVFSMDGRGSSNRGLKFEQATHGRLGTVEMEDQLAGVNYLKQLPYVNARKMGVHGWSYGGFMTTSLMLRHPDVFAVGVAGGPVIDWSMYEIMYTERYMETPKENPKGYEDNNLLGKTKNLKGKLLMIHGAQDDVVVWQHSMNFIRKAVDEGAQIDYFVYPNHPHNVRGKDRVHLMQKISDYFDLYLK